MSRNNKNTGKTPVRQPAPQAAPAKVAGTTPVRNSAIPKFTAKPASKPAGASKVITHEMIARRAYEISCGPNCGSEQDNWYRAERELRG
jgi:hypothetical protein